MASISLAAIRLAASALVSSANQAANDRRAAAGLPTRRAWLGVGALLALAFVCVLLAVRNPQPILSAVAGAFGT